MGAIKAWWSELPDTTLIETAWERQMNIAGIEAYENARSGVDATDTMAGKKFLRNLLDRATEGITTIQQEMATITRVERDLKATAIVVPADTCALLTLKPMIDRAYSASDPDVGSAYQGIVTEIGKSVELELNFRHWVAASASAASAYAKSQGLAKVPKSMAERLIEEQGVSRRNLIRWKQTFSDLGSYQWTNEQIHYCGDVLVAAVVRELPEFFTVHLLQSRMKNQKFLKLTDDFRKEFDRIEAKLTNMQMVKKPMITKPRKWTRNE